MVRSRVAADCDGAAPRRQRSRLPVDRILVRSSGGYGVGRPSVIARQPSEPLLPPSRSVPRQRSWRTCLLAAETDRVFADTGHSLDFVNKAFECLDLIGWDTPPIYCPRSSARWSRRAARMNPRIGASPLILLPYARQRPVNCRPFRSGPRAA